MVKTAADTQHLTSYELGAIAEEERHRVSDLFRLAQAAERNCFHQTFLDTLHFPALETSAYQSGPGKRDLL
jgi:hypothetical protein